MISLYILIISLALSSLVFFIREKKYAFILSIIAIGINSYFLFKRGLYENFFVGTDIGYFGLTVNDLNYSFLVVILVVTVVTTVYSLRYMEEKIGEGSWGLYFGLYSLFAVAMIYVSISTNLLEIYVFLEISLVTSFLLILLYGYGDRRRISLLYFIWTHVGTILLLASIIIIGLEFHTMDIYYSYGETNVFSSISFAELVFLLGVIGMLVKSAQAGLNIWLPYAHGEAPTPISVLLSPNLVGLGIYVIIFYFYLFPAFSYLAPIFIGWAVITMIYGGINALAQKDFKRFLAYSTVSQMGYMLLGSSTAFMLGLNENVNQLPLGILSAVLIYASHGFGKAILFMSAGASITEFKTRNIEELGGLYLSSPLHTTLSFFGILNILGLPPTVGFLSEVLLLLAVGQLIHVSSLPLFILLVLAITVGIGISSGYSAYLFKKVYGGRKESKEIDKIIEYSIPMLLLAIISAIFFFYPSFLSISIENFIQVLPSSSHVCLFLIVILPALGSLISLISGKLNQDIKGAITSGLVGLSMVLSIYNLINTVTTPHPNFFVPAYTFTAFEYFQFSSSLLQAILAVFVSSLSFFIAIYSIGYMKEDSILRRYWGFFGFFISSMLSVVLGDNILVFLAGWEGTSLASYGLISYWLDDNEKNVVGDFKRFVLGIEYLSKPTTSGIRALVFTRVGDVGMIIILGYLLFLTTNSTLSGVTVIYPVLHSIQGLFSELPSLLPYSPILLIFLYLGGLSKSAQFPFTQWLVTAMTGPTPVSALIHAATMVNLGAIFTFLTYPFLVQAYSPSLETFLQVIIGISVFTSIYTSLNALVSNEQKVILANSTADQISLMIFSSSLGGLLAIQLHNFDLVYAGIAIGLIQMIAHGIYKATLFMNAGSVIHYTESRYVGEYPNLYKKLKVLFVLQLFAALNLANIPLFIGFWAHSFISYLTSYNFYLDMTYLVLEFAGSVYIIRYIARLFMYGSGEKEAEGHVSSIMYVSPAILVISSIILAFEIYPLVSFMEKEFSVVSSAFIYNNLDFIVSLVGIAIAFIIYTGRMYESRLLSPIISFFYYGWYVYPIFDIAGITSLKVSNAIFNYLETKGIDNSLNYKLPNGIIYYGGKLFNRLQNGLLRDYLGYYVGGIILLTIIVIILLLGD